MKIHGSQIPPDIKPSRLIEQLTKVIEKAKAKSGKVCITETIVAVLHMYDEAA